MKVPQKPMYVQQQEDWPRWRFDPAAVQKGLSSARLAQGMLLGAVHANMDIVVKAAIAHLWLETIHRFHDGNGRMGRAIIDSIIAQESGGDKRLYSMSRQMEENRGRYYEQLNRAQKGDLDISDWVIWFADQFAASCQKSLKHIDVALEKARYWAAHSGDEFNERQMKVLKKLLDAGNGGFLGGLTREKYTKITGCSDATGTRDLADLLQKGALASTGVGKGTKYFVNVPGWLGEWQATQAGKDLTHDQQL